MQSNLIHFLFSYFFLFFFVLRRHGTLKMQFWSETKRKLSTIPIESNSEALPVSENGKRSNDNLQCTEVTFNADGSGGITAVTASGPTSNTLANPNKYHTVGTPPPIVISQSPFGPMKSRDTFNHFGPGNESGATQYSPDLTPYEVDEEFNLPVTVAMFILSVYFFLGSVLFFNTGKCIASSKTIMTNITIAIGKRK